MPTSSLHGVPARRAEDHLVRYNGAPFDMATPMTPGKKLRELGRLLLRRKKMIVLTLVGLNVLAFVTVSHLHRRYTSEASVLIDPRQEQVVDLKAVIAGLGGDSDVIESEIQLLRSRQIARSAVEKLHLDDKPEFNPALDKPGMVAQAREYLTARFEILMQNLPVSVRDVLLPSPTRVLQTDDPPADPLAVPIDIFSRHLSVTPKGHSRVISVSFESSDPVLSAQAANTVADAYIENQLKSKLDATAHAHNWLSERVAELREQVINADQAVEVYRRKIGTTQGRTAPLLSEEISDLNAKLVQARVDQATAEGRLKAARSAGGALPEVQNSAVIQALRAQQSALVEQEIELARTYGDRYPKLTALRAAVADINGRIKAEAGSVTGELQSEVASAAQRVSLLEQRVNELRGRYNVGSEGEIELRVLQHEADANRALYDRLLARSKETNVESGLQQADAQVISHAETATTPSFPNPALMLPIFFVASLIVTGLLVFASETLDQGFSHPDQIEQFLGIAALGVVPGLKRRLIGRQSPETYVVNQPYSPYGEAIRSLHTSLMLSNVERLPKVILVTSPLPGEGKSSLVLALARLMAACGKRVVMIDCDVRRPAMHTASKVARSPGLLDYLTGKAQITDVLQQDKLSPAYIVPAGKAGRIAPDLLGSDAMRTLIGALSSQFDLVLIDSGPVLAVSDTLNLCRLVDKTVLLVRWQETRRSAVVTALRQIVEAGGNLAGVLLSMVDLQRYAQYGDGGWYQRRISLYLAE